MGASSAASTNHCSALITARIASVWLMRPIMISRLAAIIAAPSHTSSAFQRQIRSTTWPTGIFSAHGNAGPEQQRGEERRRQVEVVLDEEGADDAVRPETPYAA